jgi:tetratricopeptide (TPR) repeat protein
MEPLDSDKQKDQKSQSGAPSGRRISGLRLWLYRLIAAVLAPAIFLALLEGGLRLFGYGHPTEFFAKIDARNAYTTNQRFGWRFFPPAISRSPAMCEFPADKPEGTYRIFVLGGSAAMGTPDPAFSFGRMLEAMLSVRFGKTRFEVINTAMTAINSHVVLPIARDCAERDGDMFIVYMGNNEVTGPYGSGTVFQDFSGNLNVIRAGVFVKSTRTGQLIGSLLASDTAAPASWKGMRMFLKQQVAADDPRMEKVYSHFRENLEDICEAASSSGARVLLSTIAVNLKDCAPFASMHRSDLSDAELANWTSLYEAGEYLAGTGEHSQAIEQFLAAEEIDARPARLHFQIARSFMTLKRFAEAEKHFAVSRDLDALRFRADSRINETIRRVGEKLRQRGVRLVDAELAFQKDDRTQRELTGRELFYEHVHMTPEGAYLLAATMFRRITAILPESVRGVGSEPAEPVSQKDCFRRIALTDWDRYRMQHAMFRMQNRPPFSTQIGHESRRIARGRELARIKRTASRPLGLKGAVDIYNAALERAGEDISLRYNLADLLSRTGDHQGAAEQYRTLLKRFPDKASWRVALGETLDTLDKPEKAIAEFERAVLLDSHAAATDALSRIGMIRLAQGDLAEAAESFNRALEMSPEMAAAHNSLGAVLFKQDKPQQAIERFERALKFDPTLIDAYHNLVIVYDKQQDIVRASDWGRKAIGANPQNLTSYRLLASLLERQGKPAESLDQYKLMVKNNPGVVEAHARLGSRLAAARQWAQAAEQFRCVIQIDPDHVQARYNLAFFLSRLGRTAEAVQQHRQVLRRDRNLTLNIVALARILATDPDPKLRDGAEALELIEPLCNRPGKPVSGAMEVLAAAYAETGEFNKAVASIDKAILRLGVIGDAALMRELQAQRTLYKMGKPYRSKKQPPRL